MFNAVAFDLFVLVHLFRCVTAQRPIQFRIMSFNTWNSGFHVVNGMQKVAFHIREINPDVVALQEIEPRQLDNLLNILGPPWTGVERTATRPDCAILSRRPITIPTAIQTSASVGCLVNIGTSDEPAFISFWSVHADPHNYGPYLACNTEGQSQSDSVDIESAEASRSFRLQELVEIFRLPPVDSELRRDPAGSIPLMILGDFNAPSHLDWTTEMRPAHCGHQVLWPVSKLMEDNGFKDAFRVMHPNVVEAPGNTWSTVEKLHPDDPSLNRVKVPAVVEPQDRIDFIYYRSSRLRPTMCEPYAGARPIATRMFGPFETNDWPSDHYGVVADFQLFV